MIENVRFGAGQAVRGAERSIGASVLALFAVTPPIGGLVLVSLVAYRVRHGVDGTDC